MNDWNGIVHVASLALALISGVGAVPLVDWIKDILGLDGRWSQLATAVVATVLALANLLVAGQITPDLLRGDMAVSLFTLVLVTSQAEYRRLKDAAA